MSTRSRKNAQLLELDAQIAAGSALTELRFERACLLAEVGRSAEARDAYLDVLARRPGHRLALNNLGTLLYQTGYRTAARTAYAEAVERYPDDPMSLVNLANVLVENGDLSAARGYYENALRCQPDHAGAHQGLASVLAECGDLEGAARHRRMAFEGRAVVVLPWRGDAAPVQLLLLAGAAGGNIPIRHLLDDRIFRTSIVFVEYYDPVIPLPPHQLVFNAIGDADLEGPALTAAQSLLAGISAPVINPPAAVARTRRSDNARHLADIPGVITPRPVDLSRAALAGSGAAAMLEAKGFEFPLLIRTPGFHTGRHFLRLESILDLRGALAALPGETLTVMRYLDARGPDGKARKYRVMMIDGQLYPLHVAISTDWKIHYFTADMITSSENRAEDAAFLENMAGVLGSRAMLALAEIQARLGLDYAGIDFGLSADGDVLLFEANATMVVNPPEPDEKWAYRQPAVERVFAAVRQMLMKKSAAGR